MRMNSSPESEELPGVTMEQDRRIGERFFTGGATRPVFEDADGRQYVLDGDGEAVYGIWLPSADEPLEVINGPV